jgi:hypothetical protein
MWHALPKSQYLEASSWSKTDETSDLILSITYTELPIRLYRLIYSQILEAENMQRRSNAWGGGGSSRKGTVPSTTLACLAGSSLITEIDTLE